MRGKSKHDIWENPKQSRKGYILIIILSILLLLTVFYIAVIKITDYNTNKLQEAYQQGTQEGYIVAVRQLMQQLSTCQPVPVFADNITINAVAVECLQQQPPPQPAGFEEQLLD